MNKPQGVAKIYISTRDIYTIEKIKISVRCHTRKKGAKRLEFLVNLNLYYGLLINRILILNKQFAKVCKKYSCSVAVWANVKLSV